MERAVLFGDLTKDSERGEEGREVSKTPDELYQHLVHVEQHPNGGATVVHLYQEELSSLSSGQVQQLADVFFRYASHEGMSVC